MNHPSEYLEALVDVLARLPGIGRKSASRIAFYLLDRPSEEIDVFVNAMLGVRDNVVKCSCCGGISDGDVCSICRDSSRDQDLICVVEEARDVLIINSTGEYQGMFHVLGGLIAPLDGIGPEQLSMRELVNRCQKKSPREVILALNPTVEGDATAIYISGLLHPLNVLVTRIAHGLPVGADIEFADRATIVRSLEGRRAV